MNHLWKRMTRRNVKNSPIMASRNLSPALVVLRNTRKGVGLGPRGSEIFYEVFSFFLVQVLRFHEVRLLLLCDSGKTRFSKKELIKWSPPSEQENQGGKDDQNILPPPFVQNLTSHCPALLKESSFQRSIEVWNRQYSLDFNLFGYLANYEYYSFNSKIQQITTDHNQQWIQSEEILIN